MVTPRCFSWVPSTGNLCLWAEAMATAQGPPEPSPQHWRVLECAESTSPPAQASGQSGHHTGTGTARLQEKTTGREVRVWCVSKVEKRSWPQAGINTARQELYTPLKVGQPEARRTLPDASNKSKTWSRSDRNYPCIYISCKSHGRLNAFS